MREFFLELQMPNLICKIFTEVVYYGYDYSSTLITITTGVKNA